MEGIENLCKRVGQCWYIDLTKVEYKKIEKHEIEEYEKKGHHILIMFDGRMNNIYVSKETDGMLREPSKTWNKNITIFPYERNQNIWERNIGWWFDNATSDNEYIDELKSIYPDIHVEKELARIKKELMDMKTKNGKKGQRTSKIAQYVIENISK